MPNPHNRLARLHNAAVRRPSMPVAERVLDSRSFPAAAHSLLRSYILRVLFLSLPSLILADIPQYKVGGTGTTAGRLLAAVVVTIATAALSSGSSNARC